MSIQDQIKDGLAGNRAITHSLIYKFARQQKLDWREIMGQFKKLKDDGKMAEMYFGSPADWTFVPRTEKFGFGA
jgi:hypothetical protein